MLDACPGDVAEGCDAQLHVVLQDESAGDWCPDAGSLDREGNKAKRMLARCVAYGTELRWNNMLDNNFADNRNWGCTPLVTVEAFIVERPKLLSLEVLMSSGMSLRCGGPSRCQPS